ncbi:MAG: hypothetical protein U1C04_07740, partial [Hydrogenophaga sp.]|nr:hypothetical protein [Hydrogenophaga sp.]
ELETRAQALAAELEQERRAHAASTARGEALSRQVDELKLEQSKSRQHFSAELEKDVQLLMKPPSDLPKRSTGRFGKLTESEPRVPRRKSNWSNCEAS